MSPLNFVLWKIILSIPGPLLFHVNFISPHKFLQKMQQGFWQGLQLNLRFNMGSIAISTILCFLFLFILPLLCLACHYHQPSMPLEMLPTALWINLKFPIMDYNAFYRWATFLLFDLYLIALLLLNALVVFLSGPQLYLFLYQILCPSVPSVWNPLLWKLCKPDLFSSFTS